MFLQLFCNFWTLLFTFVEKINVVMYTNVIKLILILIIIIIILNLVM